MAVQRVMPGKCGKHSAALVAALVFLLGHAVIARSDLPRRIGWREWKPK